MDEGTYARAGNVPQRTQEVRVQRRPEDGVEAQVGRDDGKEDRMVAVGVVWEQLDGEEGLCDGLEEDAGEAEDVVQECHDCAGLSMASRVRVWH